MGVEFFAVCDDCKVMRDLDKFYEMLQPVTTREDALKYRNDIIRKSAFPAGLLVSFMGAHINHTCRIVRSCDKEFDEVRGGYRIEEFWSTNG